MIASWRHRRCPDANERLSRINDAGGERFSEGAAATGHVVISLAGRDLVGDVREIGQQQDALEQLPLIRTADARVAASGFYAAPAIHVVERDDALLVRRCLWSDAAPRRIATYLFQLFSALHSMQILRGGRTRDPGNEARADDTDQGERLGGVRAVLYPAHDCRFKARGGWGGGFGIKDGIKQADWNGKVVAWQRIIARFDPSRPSHRCYFGNRTLVRGFILSEGLQCSRKAREKLSATGRIR